MQPDKMCFLPSSSSHCTAIAIISGLVPGAVPVAYQVVFGGNEKTVHACNNVTNPSCMDARITLLLSAAMVDSLTVSRSGVLH